MRTLGRQQSASWQELPGVRVKPMATLRRPDLSGIPSPLWSRNTVPRPANIDDFKNLPVPSGVPERPRAVPGGELDGTLTSNIARQPRITGMRGWVERGGRNHRERKERKMEASRWDWGRGPGTLRQSTIRLRALRGESPHSPFCWEVPFSRSRPPGAMTLQPDEVPVPGQHFWVAGSGDGAGIQPLMCFRMAVGEGEIAPLFV